MSCYCCVIGAAAIYQPIGRLKDELGICYNCHIHACGHHADRSADDAQFLCMLCVKTLLTASAFTRTPHTDYSRHLLEETGNLNLMSLRSDAIIGSIRSFLRSHPRLWVVVDQSSRWNDYRIGQGVSGRVLEALDQNGIELLGAAIVLCLELRIPRDEIEKILLEASEELSSEAPHREEP